jgi:hypothetical protein
VCLGSSSLQEGSTVNDFGVRTIHPQALLHEHSPLERLGEVDPTQVLCPVDSVHEVSKEGCLMPSHQERREPLDPSYQFPTTPRVKRIGTYLCGCKVITYENEKIEIVLCSEGKE